MEYGVPGRGRVYSLRICSHVRITMRTVWSIFTLLLFIKLFLSKTTQIISRVHRVSVSKNVIL